METRVMRRMTESVKPAVRSDKLCILFSSHNVRFLIVQDMFRVERRLDAVHHGEIFLRRLAQEIRTLGNADAVLVRARRSGIPAESVPQKAGAPRPG